MTTTGKVNGASCGREKSIAGEAGKGKDLSEGLERSAAAVPERRRQSSICGRLSTPS
jgi:hypothetical protein